MNADYTSMHKFRDFVTSLLTAMLLFFVFKGGMRLIYPQPKYNEHVALNEDWVCEEWSKTLTKRKEALSELLHKASAQLTPHLEEQIDKLKAETDEITENLHEARIKALHESIVTYETVYLYVAVILAFLLFLGAYLFPLLPLQIGLLLGGFFVVASGFVTTFLAIDDWKIWLIVLALLLIVIAIIIKSSREKGCRCKN